MWRIFFSTIWFNEGALDPTTSVHGIIIISLRNREILWIFTPSFSSYLGEQRRLDGSIDRSIDLSPVQSRTWRIWIFIPGKIGMHLFLNRPFTVYCFSLDFYLFQIFCCYDDVRIKIHVLNWPAIKPFKSFFAKHKRPWKTVLFQRLAQLWLVWLRLSSLRFSKNPFIYHKSKWSPSIQHRKYWHFVYKTQKKNLSVVAQNWKQSNNYKMILLRKTNFADWPSLNIFSKLLKISKIICSTR